MLLSSVAQTIDVDLLLLYADGDEYSMYDWKCTR